MKKITAPRRLQPLAGACLALLATLAQAQTSPLSLIHI